MYWKLSLKVSNLSHLVPIWPNLRSSLTSVLVAVCQLLSPCIYWTQLTSTGTLAVTSWWSHSVICCVFCPVFYHLSCFVYRWKWFISIYERYDVIVSSFCSFISSFFVQQMCRMRKFYDLAGMESGILKDPREPKCTGNESLKNTRFVPLNAKLRPIWQRCFRCNGSGN